MECIWNLFYIRLHIYRLFEVFFFICKIQLDLWKYFSSIMSLLPPLPNQNWTIPNFYSKNVQIVIEIKIYILSSEIIQKYSFLFYIFFSKTKKGFSSARRYFETNSCITAGLVLNAY